MSKTIQYPPLPKPFFVLAPMDDVTDTVFRRMVHKTAPADLYYTEFVNVDGLQSPGRVNLLKKVRFVEAEGPLIVQLWGKDPDNFRKTAEQVADGSLAKELGLPDDVNFAGIDLNMGCPAKSEVKNGTCSALIKNRPLALEIINATKDGLAGKLPVSVKTRVGFNEVDMTWIGFLLEQNLNMLTVHGRTKKEMSKVPANWDLIGQARELRDEISPDTLIVGNGDVMDRQHGLDLIKKYQIDGVMVGRGVFQDPYAFAENSPWGSIDRNARLNLYKQHVSLFADQWQQRERPIHVLNKFCKIYVSDFDGAKELREKLMAAESTDDLLHMLDEALAVQYTLETSQR
jgi:tRNA-dihydrouridine synthase